jgi:4,5-dihydroxyphthalate decarboxylase
MARLKLTMACWDYDRTRALMEDRVPIDGIELNYLNLPVRVTSAARWKLEGRPAS